ncbi:MULTISPECIES: 2-oxoglutarate dehydrogenase complex dihydrolipoyllysine-residue succinyltransferase [Thalassospira]|jgi:2-oxoglutarate dehydrogenase E2 component (dihydrolipoamide succinyltransferase)|uniref:Dihydrolipoyllysine-residue succinyltransferase component of 2-oxoglutarate dehydrogenase complex n=1 Tax=Thalassospira xiamenensis TaxID=220697 RepID=A0ABR5Y2R3_9PROT|nr:MULTISPECIES: 2-oxoglutarate dehydrogenase complex dihydrolipoyllysine-residue succinyltransferase [Thalassospira]MAL29282.1 dihydrolipoyllysine-residue succinyltransferase [Thalassospira sp.]MBR9780066.1 2-oxoglutarate dehydrogenase complex dihydrolipoyllysine-residue succinyltransferase [Rhodospirillales bacterium]KZD03600.1 dihydrolipoamide succinyltransferase [Thalassospira xiamenensis]KZD08630.1 dihydrolipoamide succinyltransferase [Thalassospira xiamenensis]MBL4840394.1 2-oxoglutarate|tara:strand:- start:8024 stop:9301 length:1278 start_codon:yes stop_codon:yes gene_type:complete
MATEVKVPTLGESVTEATIAKWYKKVGDAVAADEPIVELETDKVTVEVNAPVAGAIAELVAQEGDEVEVGALIAMIKEGAEGAAPAKEEKAEAKEESKKEEPKKEEAKPAAAPAASAPAASTSANADHPLPPAVRKLVEDKNLDPSKIPASGKDGRLTKGDVLNFLENGGSAPRAAAAAPAAPAAPKPERELREGEERVKMSKLRQTIARRLKEAQNTAAMLTTYNEVDMTNLLACRNQYKDGFEKKHGVKLGFMSFFIKACTTALNEWPAVNAEIDGNSFIYKNYCDIGVAVGTPQGLVVPVIRSAEKKSFADLESTIVDFGKRARDGKLGMDEMTGGSFTISNGGVFGSLLSSPILNAPQSGILGMHKTQMRPVAIDGKVEIRPMMYLALSYDHRIIDGREAVSFLVRVKECIENPERILLDI